VATDFILPPKFKVELPDFDSSIIDDYFGLWSMHEQTLVSLVNAVNGTNLSAHIMSAAARESVAKQNSADYQVTDDGIAVISISGPMMKSVSSLSSGTSTVRVRQQLRSARGNADVKGAILVMDTPGGTVRGNSDLADEVAAFAAVKPIYAFVEDMTASSGVSVASQATKRFANSPQALYGSMGTYSVLTDYSGRAEEMGIKVLVVKAGEYKGTGEPGTKITDAQLADAQRVVNALNEGYLQLIARGLNKPLESIRALADGRAHPASVAKEMGLIDGVQSYDETYRQLVSLTNRTPPSRSPSSTRSTPPMEKVSATLAELKQSFPKSTAEWRETQLEKAASLQEAAIAYGQHVEALSEAAAKKHEQDLAAAKAEAAEKAKSDLAKKSGALGHDPLKGKQSGADQLDAGNSGDAVEDFNAAVAKLCGARPTMQQRMAAIRTVAKRDPELYQNYLLETNQSARQQRLIKEKLEAFIK
jgi:signal peptide peptidase SppA